MYVNHCCCLLAKICGVCMCVVCMCVVDQTPTPTKFLKSCEEVGLFQEINPFDKDFKKAIEQQQSEVCLKFIALPLEASFLHII